MNAAAYLGLGSNLGDRAFYLRFAFAALSHHLRYLGAGAVQQAPWYESPPWGADASGGPYLNTVLKISLPQVLLQQGQSAVLQLLRFTQQLERIAGREIATTRNQPRPLDIDLLLWGRLQIDSADLILPHPRLHQRAFVLAPLRDLDPNVRIAGLGSIDSLWPSVATQVCQRVPTQR